MNGNEKEASKKSPSSVKIIPFSGCESEWREWSKKVLAFSEMKGWGEALVKQKDVKQENKADALNFLTMSLTDKAFAFVENASDPSEVWSELNEEFEPCEETDVYELQELYTRCKLMTSRENPTMWFKRLDHLNDRLRKVDPKYMKSDDEVKLHVRVHLPESEYSELITSTREGLKTMSSKDFKRKIKSHWRRFMKAEKQDLEAEQVL